MQIAQVLDIGGEAADRGLPGTAGYTATNPGGGFGSFLGTVLGAVMAIAALLVLLYLLWGAIEWITSGGDKGKLEAARNKITQSIIGIVVLGATLAIFMLVQSFLGINVINFGGGNSSGVGPGGRPIIQPGQVCAGETSCICGDDLIIRGGRCN